MLRFLILLILIILFVFLQSAGFSIFGVKPNLALVAVTSVSFFVGDVWEGFILVLLAALAIKFKSSFSWEILVFSLIGIAAVIVEKYFIWRPVISCVILIAAATLLFYLFMSPSLILSAIFLKEIIYNIISGIPVFILLSWLKRKYF